MPHHVGAGRSGAARCATAFALLVACGCTSDDATLLVIVTQGSGEAAIASPIDPRQLPAVASAQRVSDPLAKSIARYYAVSDSADSLDHAFQREREVLNRDARKLSTADRRTPAYAREYDAFMGRVAIASRIREGRDRMRRRAASLRAQLGDRAPERPRRPRGQLAAWHSALDSAARARGRHVERVTLQDRQASFHLEPGTWWIAIEQDDGLLGSVRRHEVRPGARDTLRIGG